MSEAWTIAKVSAWVAKDLSARGFGSARLEGDLLVAHALKLRRLDLFLRHDQPLRAEELSAIRALVERRRRHEPVAYLTGERDFYGRSFAVDRRVLIPRPETEHVVDAVIDWFRARHRTEGALLDLCTGSGCIAVTCALELASLVVDAVDVSADALAVAESNVARHGLSARVSLHRGDLFSPLPPRRYDVIASNPPYIASAEVPGLMPDVAKHEPHLALDGGVDGAAVILRLLDGVAERLLPGGMLVMEVGHDQGARVVAEAAARGLRDARMVKDLAGVPRVLVAHAP